MGLKSLGSRLGALPPRIRAEARDAHGHSGQAEPWRAWYRKPEWAELRLEIFARDRQLCRHAKHEGRRWQPVSGLVCDHVKPHRGDAGRFWDRGNLQTLCKRCHDTHKQAEERRDQALGLL